jgi:hypothetical protein
MPTTTPIATSTAAMRCFRTPQVTPGS